MARKVTAGIIHPVTLFDAAGNPQGVDVNLADGAQVNLEAHVYSSDNTNTPAANAAAVVTLAAPGVGLHWALAGIYWSYDDDPTGGQLTFTLGGVVPFTVYITDGGPGFLPFVPPIAAADNAQVVVTLAAGGAGISGSVNVHAWTE